MASRPHPLPRLPSFGISSADSNGTLSTPRQSPLECLERHGKDFHVGFVETAKD